MYFDNVQLETCALIILTQFLWRFSRFIRTMSEGLSEVGQARAWLHLALEKKILSQHLKELLINQELLRLGYTHE